MQCLLVEAFYISDLLFGLVVFSYTLGQTPRLLPTNSHSAASTPEVQYRNALHWALSLDKTIQNSFLYMLANMVPIQGLAMKQ